MAIPEKSEDACFKPPTFALYVLKHGAPLSRDTNSGAGCIYGEV